MVLERLEARFAGQVGGTWRGAVGRAQAHRSFQVFEVYRWVAMLLAGLPAGPAVAVLDRCRIGDRDPPTNSDAQMTGPA